MLDAFLKGLFQVGRLTVVDERGVARSYGDGSGEEVGVRLHKGAAARLVRSPGLAVGECYAEGLLTLEAGDIYDLMDVVGRNLGRRRKKYGPGWRFRLFVQRRLQQMNDRVAALRNVSRHYDLSYELYRRFLDEDMQYSCAYFAEPDLSLEAAQVAKKAHLAAKLLLKPGQKLLDIGCGWGGLALSLAEMAPGVEILGVTLSKEQLAVAQRRVQERGLSDRVRFELRDYRDVEGPFDRIVSVGMFEHVGAPHFQEFFDNVSRLLADDGVMLLHTIGRRDGPSVTNPFINKYIFPGGYSPSLSEVAVCTERAQLWVTDVEVLRLHYAETIKEWRRRFLANRVAVEEEYDEKFCRLWDYYLASSEMSFRWLGHMNLQVQLAKRVDVVPLTRDYIGETERRLLAGQGSGARLDDADEAAA